jgi:hypothetical protein
MALVLTQKAEQLIGILDAIYAQVASFFVGPKLQLAYAKI